MDVFVPPHYWGAILLFKRVATTVCTRLYPLMAGCSSSRWTGTTRISLYPLMAG